MTWPINVAAELNSGENVETRGGGGDVWRDDLNANMENLMQSGPYSLVMYSPTDTISMQQTILTQNCHRSVVCARGCGGCFTVCW